MANFEGSPQTGHEEIDANEVPGVIAFFEKKNIPVEVVDGRLILAVRQPDIPPVSPWAHNDHADVRVTNIHDQYQRSTGDKSITFSSTGLTGAEFTAAIGSFASGINAQMPQSLRNPYIYDQIPPSRAAITDDRLPGQGSVPYDDYADVDTTQGTRQDTVVDEAAREVGAPSPKSRLRDMGLTAVALAVSLIAVPTISAATYNYVSDSPKDKNFVEIVGGFVEHIPFVGGHNG